MIDINFYSYHHGRLIHYQALPWLNFTKQTNKQTAEDQVSVVATETTEAVGFLRGEFDPSC